MNIIRQIKEIIGSVSPFDEKEEEHLYFTKKWIDSGAPIFPIAKPATPDPHLVAYFLLIEYVDCHFCGTKDFIFP